MIVSLFILTLLLVLLLFLILFYHFFTNYSPHAGAIYFPTKDSITKEMVNLANVGPQDLVFDLGSGDGRILIEAAKKGARAVGYEIDPFLVLSSRKKIRQLKLDHLAKVYWKSFWSADLNKASVIFVYLFPKYMNKLDRLLTGSLKKSTRVVCNFYGFPDRKPTKESDGVYLYKF